MNREKEQVLPARDRREGKQLAASTFHLTKKNCPDLVKTERPCLWRQRLLCSPLWFFKGSSRQLCPDSNLKKVDERNHNRQETLQRGAWQQITTSYHWLFFFIFWTCRNENSAREGSAPVSAAHARQRDPTEDSRLQGEPESSKRACNHFVKPAQINTADGPQRPWNPADPPTITHKHTTGY